MNEIRLLAEILRQNKLKKLDQFHPAAQEGTKLNELYLGILENRWDDEEQAAQELFPDAGIKREEYFTRIKRRLTDRLIQLLFLIDVSQPQYNDFQRAYYTCYQELASIKILFGRFQRSIAVSLAHRALKQAEAYGFSDVAFALSRELMVHYGAIEYNQKAFRRFEKMMAEYQEALVMESLAERYYTHIISEFGSNRGARPDLQVIARQYAGDLEPHLQRISSYRFHLLARQVIALSYEIAADHEGTLQACRDSLDYFRSKPFQISISAKFFFLLTSVLSATLLGHYDEAEALAAECLNAMPTGSMNWFITLERYATLCFHAGRYEQALSLFQMATERPELDRQYAHLREPWRIHEALIHFLFASGKLTPPPDELAPRFRLNKFLNEVPVFSRDKRGANITILVIQTLFLLLQRRHDEASARIDALRVYAHRYLRRDETFRSNCFIHMLMQIPPAGFNRIAVERKASPYRKRLAETPHQRLRPGEEIEVIPYEQLWELTLELLEPIRRKRQ